MKIIVNPAYRGVEKAIRQIPGVFERSGELVYKGRNILKRFRADNANLIVKRFKKPHLINRFAYVYVRKSKACRSYEYAFKLLENGIHTPAPIAFMEEYKYGLLTFSYFISEEITEAREIREFVLHPEKLAGEAFVLDAFGRFTAGMHQKKICHNDYSPGNILYRTGEGGEVTFYLVDINRMRFNKSVPEEKGYRNFKALWLPDAAFVLIAHSYARAMGYALARATERILYYKNSFMKRRS
ncbi:MAG: lipopolysaccharide kinase InaA family protein [Tannerellaceae bacterium]|jgi:tRNA A-37 threonylcarbamoyl transferase component Bud32|nr:lipopolysaccharide kinase InaA family protein [Tannerellaceae bacterium]